MHSCIYEGWVWHSRWAPVRHRFRYPLSMVYLDLDEVAEAFGRRWLWSATRPAVAWFRRADYLGDARQPLTDAVRDLLEAEGIAGANGPIRILTQPRYFGFLMNPVSFYFCYDRTGEVLRAVIAEVTSTPWRERKCYVLPGDSLVGPEIAGSLRISKQLHVSPFLPLDMEYGWRLSSPGCQLRIDIRNYRQHRAVFGATLRLERCEWTTSSLRRVLWRYPLMTQRIATAIYWEALKLWWKGCPVYPHPSQNDAPRSAAVARIP